MYFHLLAWVSDESCYSWMPSFNTNLHLFPFCFQGRFELNETKSTLVVLRQKETNTYSCCTLIFHLSYPLTNLWLIQALKEDVCLNYHKIEMKLKPYASELNFLIMKPSLRLYGMPAFICLIYLFIYLSISTHISFLLLRAAVF